VRERSGWFLVGLVLIITSVQVLMAGILAEILVRLQFGSGERRFYRIHRITGIAGARQGHATEAADRS
jgi:hypothetical protein